MTSAAGSTSGYDIVELVLRERQSRDRGWYERMAACFADDSFVRMSWYQGSGAGFVRATRDMAGRGDYAVHRLGPPFVRLDGERALAELPLVIEFRVEIDGVEADLASACRSQYRAERGSDGVWRITGITSIYEKDSLIPTIPRTRLEIDPKELAAYRPSYRCLAWYMNRNGYVIGDDHLGDDQPQGVAEQYSDELNWLHGTTTPADAAGNGKESWT